MLEDNPDLHEETLRERVQTAAQEAYSAKEQLATPDVMRQFELFLGERAEHGLDHWQQSFTLGQQFGNPAGTDAEPAITLVARGAELPRGRRLLVFDDISEIVSAQRAQAWGEVARRLAHEIKNPLTPIQLSAERLRRRLQGHLPDAADSELLERSTHTIVQQVESMKSMVNAFSEYARAPDLRLAPCDLGALVTEAAELYRAQDARIQIRVVAAPDAPQIQGDAARLRQVLNNLVSNAIEAVGATPGGWVELRTEALQQGAQPGVQLLVSDNGPGFQPQVLARVFDPYVTSKQKGTGLGLAIVKKIIEEHGGRITVENRPGGGASVRVILPVAAREHVAQPQRVVV